MINLIIDTDSGIDDALALILAVLSPTIKIEALTITAGNNTVAQCTYNALSLLTKFDRKDIPVFSGVPPTGSPLEGSDAHGITGLGDLRNLEPGFKSQQKSAIDAIIEFVELYPYEINLLCIAPLTNIAGALKKKPEIAKSIKSLVIMGGAVYMPGNNYNKTAECNIYNDVEAANIVFSSGMPITLIPIDVTRQALMKRSQLDTIMSQGANKEKALFLHDLVSPYLKKYGWYPEEDTGTLHDPLALTYFLKPDLFTCQNMHISIETEKRDKLGKTSILEGKANMSVALKLDGTEFDKFFVDKMLDFCR